MLMVSHMCSLSERCMALTNSTLPLDPTVSMDAHISPHVYRHLVILYFSIVLNTDASSSGICTSTPNCTSNLATHVSACLFLCSSLKERQGEWKKEEERKKANAPDPSIPPGHTLMPTAERRKTLDMLKDSEFVHVCLCLCVSINYCPHIRPSIICRSLYRGQPPRSEHSCMPMVQTTAMAQ